MHSSHALPSGEESRHWLPVLIETLSLLVDLDPSHAIVDDRGDNSNVAELVHIEGSVHEELLPELILLSDGSLVILIIGLLKNLRSHSDVLSELISVIISLHDSSAYVVLAVPFDLVGSLGVQN